jgi:hypothetical protein
VKKETQVAMLSLNHLFSVLTISRYNVESPYFSVTTLQGRISHRVLIV